MFFLISEAFQGLPIQHGPCAGVPVVSALFRDCLAIYLRILSIKINKKMPITFSPPFFLITILYLNI